MTPPPAGRRRRATNPPSSAQHHIKAVVSYRYDSSPRAWRNNAHYVSFGAVMCEHAEEVTTALKQIVPPYAASFGEPVFLEHGSTMRMEGSACVTHAHIHLLPLPFKEVNTLMARDGLVPTSLGGLADLEQFGHDDLPYFYCGDAAEHQVYAAVQARPRQYLRSVTGRLLGIADPEWDYAVVVRKKVLVATVKETAHWRLSLP